MKSISSLASPLLSASPLKQFSIPKDRLQFIQNYFTMPDSIVGSLTPSSDGLARKMVKYLHEEGDTPLHILEIGGGTGPITKAAIAAMKSDDDTLDVVEPDPKFAAILRGIAAQSGRARQIRIHEAFIEDFVPSREKYTHVIASLPLLSFPAPLVKDYYEVLNERLLKEGTKYSYFEYVALPTIRQVGEKLSSFVSYSDRIRSILEHKEGYLKDKETKVDLVWRNLPPARVVHVTHSE